MKISIIVPVYNVEKYLEECFRSIVAQTYRGPLECIFVDDCGQDGSVALLERLLAAYRGPIEFHLLHHNHNKGLSGARNTGIRHATGQYLYFLDSDDTITPDCIEKLTALAEKYKGVDMVQGNTVSDNSSVVIKGKPLPAYITNKRKIKKAILSGNELPCTAWNKLVNTEFVIDNNLFFSEGKIHEDVIWDFYLSKHIKDIAICRDRTYIYRDNLNGIMHTISDVSKTIVPMIEEMSSHISQPYAGYEIDTILRLSIFHLSTEKIKNILSVVPYKRATLDRLVDIRQKSINTTCKTPKGLFYRLYYRCIIQYINLTYPKS